MVGRADIEGSKSDVAKNAWPPQASYPCGNFSDTSGFKPRTETKGSLGHSFKVRISTEDRNQESFYPFVRHEISVLVELPLGHLCCLLTDVPPQPNSPPDDVFDLDLGARRRPRVTPPSSGAPTDGRPAEPRREGRARGGVASDWAEKEGCDGDAPVVGSRGGTSAGDAASVRAPSLPLRIRKTTVETVVFQGRTRPPGGEGSSHLCYILHVVSRRPTRVKLNRVFFPR